MDIEIWRMRLPAGPLIVEITLHARMVAIRSLKIWSTSSKIAAI
jgi:hypothetical protein